MLLQLEQRQQELIAQAQASKQDAPYEMGPAEEKAARELLEAPDLIERIQAEFDACGIVGERTNKFFDYTHVTITELRKVHDRTHPAKERPETGDRRWQHEDDDGELCGVPR